MVTDKLRALATVLRKYAGMATIPAPPVLANPTASRAKLDLGSKDPKFTNEKGVGGQGSFGTVSKESDK